MESTPFNKKKIFIGGLPHQIEEAELKTYFSDFGTVVATEILREKITNKGRGFGFVTFDSEEAVEKVLENNFYNLKEKQIEVKMAKAKTNRRNQIPTATNNLNQPPLVQTLELKPKNLEGEKKRVRKLRWQAKKRAEAPVRTDEEDDTICSLDRWPWSEKMNLERTVAAGGLPWSSRPTLSLSPALMAPPVVREDGLVLPEDDGSWSEKNCSRHSPTVFPHF
ncbi:hypothetical protein F8388_024680 [Cannabis sativa]|uniref:RRM domain-containing protein n=1 Tax=Cannabis sativa TaxID=3483 RepID=A0A7J6GC71_CANSA|nr:hypothetical protein F8388_024680 [Cannabis sativa]